jgi:ABC-type uncharacterized transport system YnjBCD ATPase subunit
MSVYDNLAFGLRRRAIAATEIERRVRDAAATLGLAALLDRKPKALSGGQRQRVALAACATGCSRSTNRSQLRRSRRMRRAREAAPRRDDVYH